MKDNEKYKKSRNIIINERKRCLYIKPRGKKEYIKYKREYILLENYLKIIRKNKQNGGNDNIKYTLTDGAYIFTIDGIEKKIEIQELMEKILKISKQNGDIKSNKNSKGVNIINIDEIIKLNADKLKSILDDKPPINTLHDVLKNKEESKESKESKVSNRSNRSNMSNRSKGGKRSNRSKRTNRSKGGGKDDDYLKLLEARAETLKHLRRREEERAREKEIEIERERRERELEFDNLITKRAETLKKHYQSDEESDEESDRGVFSTHIETRNGITYVTKKNNEGNIISRKRIVGIISDDV